MAKKYFELLTQFVEDMDYQENDPCKLEIKHFFSGAALYKKGNLCIPWSPGGIAFKLPGDEADQLIKKGMAKPLKYFSKGHIKKGYALFTISSKQSPKELSRYYHLALNT